MANTEIEQALSKLRGQQARYRKYEDYYEGKHGLKFATEKYNNEFAKVFRDFAMNICPAVVDAMADRLVVTGVENEGKQKDATDDPLEKAAWDIWRLNRMDRRSGEVHQEALRMGDAYAIVWPDQAGNPRIWPQPARTVTVHYTDESDVPDTIDWGAKAWMLDDGRARLNMYYPDRIEKYITISTMSGNALPERASAFTAYMAPGEEWPLRNLWERVPVFHFANNGATNEMGTSELRDVIPVQNALNKSVMDLLLGMEYASFRQRWATGLEVGIDPITGLAVDPFKSSIDRVWAVGSEETKFGEFGTADLAQMRAVVDGFKVDVSTVQGTPLHYFNLSAGDFPSGEALKTAEARFVKKVTDRQIAFGNVWEDALAFALRQTGQPVSGTLSTMWQDAAPRSDRETWEVAILKLQAGVSKRQVQREGGYSEDQVQEMAKDAQQAEDEAAERMMTQFDRGRLTGNNRDAA